MEDLPQSPRGRASSRGSICSDPITLEAPLVTVCESPDVGRYLRTTQQVRSGEAILTEEPLFLSPADDEAWKALTADVCDPQITWRARLPVPEQLVLVVVQALVAAAQPPQCEALLNLRGDQARWSEQAARVHGFLRQEVQAKLDVKDLNEVYAIVAANAHEAENGRAGIFALGSMFQHACAPTAFKEVVTVISPALFAERCCQSPVRSSAASPPPSPSAVAAKAAALVAEAAEATPKLVIRALRDLGEGEVVTLSYIPEYQPTWRRRAQLEAMYGFTCQCSRCLLAPELACAFVCPECEGPCSPTAPAAEGPEQLQRLQFTCEDCNAVFTGDSDVGASFLVAENCEVVGGADGEALHPYHHKVVGMYSANLAQVPAQSRVAVLEQLLSAHRRLQQSHRHPTLACLTERLAKTHVELGEAHEAAAAYHRAAELFAMCSRGLPNDGHAERCDEAHRRIAAGRLGPSPRHLSKRSSNRSPSLPRLDEDAEA